MTYRDDVLSDLDSFFDLDLWAEIATFTPFGGASVDVSAVKEQGENLSGAQKNSVIFHLKGPDLSTTPVNNDKLTFAGAQYRIEKIISETDGVYTVSARNDERPAI